MKRLPGITHKASQHYRSHLDWVMLLLCALLPYKAAHGQTNHPQEKRMQHFAMIFRSTRVLTANESQQRALDIQAWVKKVTDMGITLDPRNFGQTLANLSGKNGELASRFKPEDPSLVTIVFFDASDSDQALAIARIHPGLRYGVTLELREWNPPRVAAVPQ
jgi:hypothetical protein